MKINKYLSSNLISCCTWKSRCVTAAWTISLRHNLSSTLSFQFNSIYNVWWCYHYFCYWCWGKLMATELSASVLLLTSFLDRVLCSAEETYVQYFATLFAFIYCDTWWSCERKVLGQHWYLRMSRGAELKDCSYCKY